MFVYCTCLVGSRRVHARRCSGSARWRAPRTSRMAAQSSMALHESHTAGSLSSWYCTTAARAPSLPCDRCQASSWFLAPVPIAGVEIGLFTATAQRRLLGFVLLSGYLAQACKKRLLSDGGQHEAGAKSASLPRLAWTCDQAPPCCRLVVSLGLWRCHGRPPARSNIKLRRTHRCTSQI